MRFSKWKDVEVASVLRAVLLLAFLALYEAPFLPRLQLGALWLRFPIWDLRLADDPRTFALLEGVYFSASLFACFRRFVIPAGLVGGLASILLVTLDLGDRLQFSYLPGGALIAFAISAMLERSEHWKPRADLPIAILLGSVYGFASFHKLLNFAAMRKALPSAVLGTSGGALGAFGRPTSELLFQLTTWSVVPYEASLSVLTLSRRWPRARIVLVCLFHWILAVIAPHIWHVSLFMLGLQLYLACLQRRTIAKQILSDRNWILAAAAEAAFGLGHVLSGSVPGASGALLRQVCFANLALFPLFFAFWPFVRACAEPMDSCALKPATVCGMTLAAFALALLSFGFSPLLLEQRYSVRSIGWSMFAGGEYTVGLYYTLRTPASPCFRYPDVHGVIWSDPADKAIVYSSYRRLDLERLKRYFESTRKCSGPPLKIELAHF